jgi:hypothetical protein
MSKGHPYEIFFDRNRNVSVSVTQNYHPCEQKTSYGKKFFSVRMRPISQIQSDTTSVSDRATETILEKQKPNCINGIRDSLGYRHILRDITVVYKVN